MKKTFRNLIKIILVSLLLIVTIGCKTKQIVTKEVVVHDSCYIDRRVVDTLIKIESDTALSRLFIECDSNNNALVSIINQMQGDRVVISPEVKYIYVKDTIGGGVSRQAYVNLSAIALEQQQRISELEEKIRKGTDINTSEESETKRFNPWTWFLIGFLSGIIVFLIVRILFGKIS
ncbi:MAG: hypothetical protein HUJ96_02835 [Marinilabiliaceae bacterium]|nr:hypothetical protein [Marinilabiliaceae bacterium]